MMSQADYNLIVVAHPDDESLFFSSVIMQERDKPWHVLCVTDANADGKGRERRLQFEQATRELGVSHWQWLGLPDVYERRLDLDALMDLLHNLRQPLSVFTHGPLGEYMHPHHQDVSYAVHEVWAAKLPVFSVAYNCQPDRIYQLNAAEYARKCHILGSIYGSETIRFANFLPATFCEGFSRISVEEVRAIYRLLVGQLRSLDGLSLPYYEWLRSFIEQRAAHGNPRPF